jgi:hypothetical protein
MEPKQSVVVTSADSCAGLGLVRPCLLFTSHAVFPGIAAPGVLGIAVALLQCHGCAIASVLLLSEISRFAFARQCSPLQMRNRPLTMVSESRTGRCVVCTAGAVCIIKARARTSVRIASGLGHRA